MTANDPSRQLEAVNRGSLNGANVGVRNLGTFDQRKSALPYKFEELSRCGLGDSVASLQERFSDLPSRHINGRTACASGGAVVLKPKAWTSTHLMPVFVSGFAVHLLAGWPRTRATSRDSPTRLLDTAAFSRHNINVGSLSTGAWRLEEPEVEFPPLSEGVAGTHSCAHPTNDASTNVGKNCRTAHPSQSSPFGSVHPHLAGDVLAPFRASGVENEGSRPTVCYCSRVGRSESQLPKLQCLARGGSAMGWSS